jgi:anaerobic magnesium-protoporphyrin IX monomethyl ester cyclase
MADVVLVNPAILAKEQEYKRLEEIEDMRPPLAILSLGSYLKHKGYNVKLIDVNPYSVVGSKVYLKDLEKTIENGEPICIGLSVVTAQIPNAYFISQYIKKLNPNIPVIWGGVHPTLYPAQTSLDPLVDIVVHGPGEETLLELCEHLERGDMDFRETKNVAYNGKVNPARKPLDVNELPFLDYDLLEVKFYLKPSDNFLFQKDIRMLPMLSSRGCPHRCAFCINSVCKAEWRAQTAHRFLDELEFLVDKYKLDGVRALDENFFISKRRSVEIIEEFQRRKIDILWGTNVRADCFRENYINTELAKKLHNVGFTFASIGAESASQRVLDLIKKDITVEDIINSARICHASGITPVYSWMIGIPTQTKGEMLDNIRAIKKIKKICPSSIHYSLSIYRPFPGGELYDLIKTELDEPRSLREWLEPKNLDLTFGSLPLEKCGWIKEKDFIKFISNYTTEITNDFNENMRITDYLYNVVVKLRWKFQFFKYPDVEKQIAAYLGRKIIQLKDLC